MKKLSILLILLVSLIGNAFAYTLSDLGITLKNYEKKPFTQIVINSMSKQKIERHGYLTIKKGQYLLFTYKDETVKLQNSKIYDTINNQTKVYPLEGFNSVIYNLFLGKTGIDKLFEIKKIKNGFNLAPKEKSNIANVDLILNNKKLATIKITDIYGNVIIFEF